MRLVYIFGASLILALFCNNHALARVGETHAESVARYEKADFVMRNYFGSLPPRDENKPWCDISKADSDEATVVREITWFLSKELNDSQDPLYLLGRRYNDVIEIRQSFYLKFPKDKADSQSVDDMKCYAIDYFLRNEKAASVEQKFALILSVTGCKGVDDFDTQESNDGMCGYYSKKNSSLFALLAVDGGVSLLDRKINFELQDMIDAVKSDKDLDKATRDLRGSGL